MARRRSRLDAIQSFVAMLVRFSPAAPRRTCWSAFAEASLALTPVQRAALDVAFSEERETALVCTPSQANPFEARFDDASITA